MILPEDREDLEEIEEHLELLNGAIIDAKHEISGLVDKGMEDEAVIATRAATRLSAIYDKFELCYRWLFRELDQPEGGAE